MFRGPDFKGYHHFPSVERDVFQAHGVGSKYRTVCFLRLIRAQSFVVKYVAVFMGYEEYFLKVVGKPSEMERQVRSGMVPDLQAAEILELNVFVGFYLYALCPEQLVDLLPYRFMRLNGECSRFRMRRSR